MHIYIYVYTHTYIYIYIYYTWSWFYCFRADWEESTAEYLVRGCLKTRTNNLSKNRTYTGVCTLTFPCAPISQAWFALVRALAPLKCCLLSFSANVHSWPWSTPQNSLPKLVLPEYTLALSFPSCDLCVRILMVYGQFSYFQLTQLPFEGLECRIQIHRIICWTMLNPWLFSGNVPMQQFKAPGSGRKLTTENLKTDRIFPPRLPRFSSRPPRSVFKS